MTQITRDDLLEFAQMIKESCIKAAGEGFEEAGISGMCREGAIEYAQDSIRSVNVENIVAIFQGNHPGLTDEQK
ncbi:MAG TPA: hypothetical protein VKA08_18410 [Balneolales bacterium]|nr:hypothetical protein [Balneolales bacterium]